MGSIDTRWMWRCSGLFRGWNLHIPKKLCLELRQAMSEEDYELAKLLQKDLHPYMEDFSRGDSEGRFYWERWQELSQHIDSITVYKQTKLF